MRKKPYWILLVLVMIVALITGCGGSGSTSADATSSPSPSAAQGQEGKQTDKQEDNKSQTVDVDKGLLNTKITLPASMFENQNIDEIIAEAKADGIEDVKKNEDGSLTYTMSKSVHKKMMKEIQDSMNETLEEMKSGKNFASIKDVTANKSFSEFTLTVDKAAYEKSFDGFAALGLVFVSMYYQLFDGASPENYKVVVIVKDQASGEVFSTKTYPDAFEN